MPYKASSRMEGHGIKGQIGKISRLTLTHMVIFNAATLAPSTLTLFILWVAFRVVSSGKGRRLPPGPRSLPLLGNIHLIPKEYQERKFREWGRKYGDIVFARVFHKPVIIISSIEVAKDLLDKRSQIYSSRPALTLLPEL